MRLSHSKLGLILSNPMEYYLSYKLGIMPKQEKKAFAIGSATHWGLEHSTENLDEYYEHPDDYTYDQLLSEAMVHGYLYHKDKIFDELLTDEETGEKLELLKEEHEVFIDGKLKSFIHKEPHIFVGIIDLLLLTDKGFIICDYKTSSTVPDWDSYLEQLYRYIFLLESEFPDIPVLKIAIINLRKSKTKQLRGETNVSYAKRLKQDYEINDDNFVNWHIFNPRDLNKEFMNDYITNLSRMADTAEMIDTNNMWYISYSSTNAYGGSQFKDIIYKTPNCYVLYNIKDTVYDEYTKQMKDYRDCREIDIEAIDNHNILNKYEQFEANALSLFSVNNNVDKNVLFNYLKKNFKCDDSLLEQYWITLNYKLQTEQSK